MAVLPIVKLADVNADGDVYGDAHVILEVRPNTHHHL